MFSAQVKITHDPVRVATKYIFSKFLEHYWFKCQKVFAHTMAQKDLEILIKSGGFSIVWTNEVGEYTT